ncbi:similar to Saccharomyces cerevisiae YNL148C ALF1 Alpha-tubulin folding protein, similar to mammalian cofactor B [Maudiozyma barnettii]|uniref:Similar to Saccharomyces cerevisiae YNL148C ALF1 Alpha-tubulin folding protein, similar to mammalian cofactor B n=1 Tax=Maudiozyma barnettii TaxID=61262 RepID=A0A8H2VES1_9SACH|nr:Alf1p [Kazachstania barnettii]CAB4254202.1 similar to Saccharomyces cerevisiae YNL148C ALF1 Alpha-tubulin folding protein, similar to mammalian cofactor B [Kazachstania barnettii]CAD1781936.1 similar to Saccharomyces cerevisiae YNL148C ALF1 Alpha-tubulin folding protein, similar to mammalian cofactor B [Kazachstania barnettii]
MVEVLITSDLVSVQKTFRTNITLTELCTKLNIITGVEPNDMKLRLSYTNSHEDNIIVPSRVQGVSLPLSPINSFQVSAISVEDTNASSVTNQLKRDSSNPGGEVAFKLSEEEYASRESSVLRWKKDNQLGRFDPKYLVKKDEELKLHKDKMNKLEVGQRCAVKTEDQPERRGWLRYLGKVPEINVEDLWCGVEFDEPLGKNNGSYQGIQYFGPVPNKYGAFVKPRFVETGAQYKPFDIDFSDSEDDEI